jgi:hypothetical protein
MRPQGRHLLPEVLAFLGSSRFVGLERGHQQLAVVGGELWWCFPDEVGELVLACEPQQCRVVDVAADCQAVVGAGQAGLGAAGLPGGAS